VKRWPAFRAWPRKGVENLGELTPYYAKKLVSVRKWRMSYAHTYWKAPVLKVDFHLLQKPVSPSELRTKIGELSAWVSTERPRRCVLSAFVVPPLFTKSNSVSVGYPSRFRQVAEIGADSRSTRAILGRVSLPPPLACGHAANGSRRFQPLVCNHFTITEMVALPTARRSTLWFGHFLERLHQWLHGNQRTAPSFLPRSAKTQRRADYFDHLAV
jgi:hypothetical protein